VVTKRSVKATGKIVSNRITKINTMLNGPFNS